MKEKYCADTDSKEVSFGAGKAFDGFGRPTPFWTCIVAYRWSNIKQTCWVYATQLSGAGAIVDRRSYEAETTSLEEVNDFLDYLKHLEIHYKKVYNEEQEVSNNHVYA